MHFIPSRNKGIAIGLLMLVLALAAMVGGVIQIARTRITPLLGLWIALPILGLPLGVLIGYRLYGLLTARYLLDRNGFYLRWGLASDQIPLASIHSIQVGSAVDPNLSPVKGFYWPGCVVGQREVAGLGLVEFFSTESAEGTLLIAFEDRAIAISPPDPQAFQGAFSEVSQLGSLEQIAAISQRPDFFSARLWADRLARTLILMGLALPVAQLGYLALRLSSLPSLVPFGFDPAGNPSLLVSSTQLMLLPLMSGFWWGVDFVIGAWLYRLERNHSIAYLVWGMAIVVAGLLWGAGLVLLSSG
jgi:hypothetical protein